MVSLLKQPFQRTAVKLKTAQKQKLLKILSELIQRGLSLQESLQFLYYLNVHYRPAIMTIRATLEKGEAFYQSLVPLGFSSEQVSQVYLADIHGNLGSALATLADQMAAFANKKQQLRKILSYPILLVSFLLFLLLGMRWMLIPQLKTFQNPPIWAIYLLENFPWILLALGISGLLLVKSALFLLKKQQPLKRVQFLTKIWILKPFLKSYYTSLFAGEWGKLLAQGFELREVVQLMKEQQASLLMKAIAEKIQQQSEKGEPFYTYIKAAPFFTSNLAEIIQQGEVKGTLGVELQLYSEELFREMLQKAEKLMGWLQPIIFIFVALLIVGLYALLLLPMYHEMGGL